MPFSSMQERWFGFFIPGLFGCISASSPALSPCLPSASLPALGSEWLNFCQHWKAASPPQRRRFLLSKAL